MSRVIAAYDLDDDHGRLWVNADLKSMPETVIVANQPMDRAQTVTYVPKARLIEAFDENRRIESENAKLRELVRDMWREGAFEAGANYATEAYGLAERTRKLGVKL